MSNNSFDKLFFLQTKFGKKRSNLPNTSTVIFIGIILTFGVIDITMLYSASNGSLEPWAKKQLYVFCAALFMMFFIQLIDIKIVYSSSYKFYFFCLLLLVLAQIMGHTSMGAQRWIRLGGINVQPSELAKIGMILALSKYFHNLLYAETQKIPHLILSIIIVAFPTILILKQPNLGTSLIMIIIAASIFFASGVKKWLFITPIISTVAFIPVAWNFLLHDYQKKRITTFLNPESDILGAGYNIAQSKIAIGSGGTYGRGFMNGSQNQLNFLPEKHTDFIFTMLAEEWGFIGSITVILLYFMLLLLCYRVAINTTNHFGRLVVIGIATMIFIHVFVNIAMISGLVPVVGTPLPLLSYGGSNLLTTLIGLGLVLNVNRNKKKELSRNP